MKTHWKHALALALALVLVLGCAPLTAPAAKAASENRIWITPEDIVMYTGDGINDNPMADNYASVQVHVESDNPADQHWTWSIDKSGGGWLALSFEADGYSVFSCSTGWPEWGAGYGDCVITATTDGGLTASATVHVLPLPDVYPTLTDFKYAPHYAYMHVGDIVHFDVEKLPEDAIEDIWTIHIDSQNYYTAGLLDPINEGTSYLRHSHDFRALAEGYGFLSIYSRSFTNGKGPQYLIPLMVDNTLSEENIVPVDHLEPSTRQVVIRAGEKYTLTTDIYPSNATFQLLAYTTEDFEIASVNWWDGKIYGESAGITYVTVWGGDGQYEKIKVVVADANHYHDYKWEDILPTCTEDGYTIWTCSCGATMISDPVPALGHAYEKTGHKDPTATVDGYDEFTCTRCGDSYRETIPATGGSECPSAGFVDVPAEGNWAHPGIDYVIGNGLMGGTDATHFEPGTSVSRAMLVTTLWRAAGSPQVEYKGNFSDVKDGKYYTTAVAWAAELGIVRGDSSGRFNPADNVTRQDLANVLYQYAITKGVDTSERYNLGSFSDGKDVSTYAKDAMSWMLAKDILRGADGKITPKDTATRAQFALILMNFIELTK